MNHSQSPTQLILYQTEDGITKLQIRLTQGTLWLTQQQLADLFQSKPQNITQHIPRKEITRK